MLEGNGQNFDPKVEQIVDQYSRVGDAFKELFFEISLGSVDEVWKKDGVGSCYYRAPDAGIEGVAKDALLSLRAERNSLNNKPRVEGRFTCRFHRANYGCVLDSLKSPACFSHIENKDEVLRRFGINYFDFASFVYGAFRRIEFSRAEDFSEVHPEENEPFVEQTVETIRAMIDRVKTAPILDGYQRPEVAQPEFG